MKKNLKYILPIAGIVLVIVVVAVFFLLREEAYRVIQVSKVDGQAEVEREDIGMLDAYEGMLLQSKDNVAVQTESYLYLELDEDKYIMLEPESKFRLEATGNSTNSKTSIYLEEGAIVNRLDNKLSENSSYEVTTPNSTMAVRGTIFRVEVRPLPDGSGVETCVSVYEGEVECALIQPDGTVEDAVVIVGGDETIIIRNTETETTIVSDPEDVEYEELERKVLEFIQKAIEEREESGMTKETEELIHLLLSGKDTPATEPDAVYTVTFLYKGSTFATQKVQSGECASIPVLLPALTGGWDFDFSKTIESDLTIEWKE